MKNPALIALLKRAPKTTLDILEMPQEATLPDGSVDFDAIVVQEARLAVAATEAQIQARGAERIAKGVTWKMRG